MELPNLDLIVDTLIRIKDPNLDAYILQLRAELIPDIRNLESKGLIIWYCFLVHDYQNLGGRVPSTDQDLYIHIRLSLPRGEDIDQFIRQLPSHFLMPRKSSLSPMNEIDQSIMKDQQWVYAWKVLGEASEFVLRMLEAHVQDAPIPIRNIIQFMHYITNPLMIGHRCHFRHNSGFFQF